MDFAGKTTAVVAITCLAGALALCLSGWAAGDEGPAKGAETKSFRQRRIIVNDDGQPPGPGPGPDLTPEETEEFLRMRFTDTLNTQVDTYFLCVAATDCGPDSVVNPPPHLIYTMSHWFPEMKAPPGIHKMIRAYIEAAHEARIEIFVSVRMNDTHDSRAPKLSYPLKVERNDLLLGKKDPRPPKDALMFGFWSGFDWSKQEVRRHFLDFILTFCDRYDFDGIELDYFRRALLFKLGEEHQNLDAMTEWVRKVRQGLNAIGKKRGRPYLVAIRLPDSPELSRRSGFDMERWLREGLLDMLMIGGGYMPYSSSRYKESIDLAHHYGVQAYPCINHFKEPIQMRSWASNYWALGADGVYLFNYGGVPDGSEKAQCLRQMGDPATLAGFDKIYRPDNGFRSVSSGHTNPEPIFPVRLVGGRAIELVVGDDVEKAQREGSLGEMILELKVSNLNAVTSLSLADLINNAPSRERIAVQINGVQIPDQAIERVDENTFVARIEAPPLRQGINQIAVLPGPNCVGSLSSFVDALELSVDYKPTAPKPPGKAGAGHPAPTPGQVTLSPATSMPVSLHDVPVGTSKAIRFKSAIDPKDVTKARLALNAEDFDDPAELTICLNGGNPLSISESLIADQGPRVGIVDIPLDLLRPGMNECVFTFVSNLNGATKGFAVNDAALLLILAKDVQAE